MCQVILTFMAMLNGYGLASGLIQQKTITRARSRQLFGMLILLNVTLAIAQVSLAPLAAAYYRQPIVGDMLRVQALLYLTTPFIALPYALLSGRWTFAIRRRPTSPRRSPRASAALGGALYGLGRLDAGDRADRAVQRARRDDDVERAVAGVAELRLSRRRARSRAMAG